MPIIKPVQPDGAPELAFHKAVLATPDLAAGTANVIVASWISQAAYAAGQGAAWQHAFSMPLSALVDLDAALLATPMFQGGMLSGEPAGGLEVAKARRWAEVRAERNARIDQPKVTSVGVFDAGMADRSNLGQVIALTQVSMARGGPGEANYTLASNERVTLSLAQLETAALEIGSQIQALFDQADLLRQAIEAATTVEEVVAVVWTD